MNEVERPDKPIVRERINIKIHNLLQSSLLIISAPIGYGKTTGVRNYFDNFDSGNKAFLFMGSTDDEETFIKIYSVFMTTQPIIGRQLKRIGVPNTIKKRQSVVSILRNLKSKFLLVLDDFDKNRLRETWELISCIVLENVDKLKIILTTRRKPDYNSFELMMRKKISIMYEDVLSFNAQEIMDYTRSRNLFMSVEQCNYIYNITKGWFMAIDIMLNEYKFTKDIKNFNDLKFKMKELLFDVKTEKVKNAFVKLAYIDSFTTAQIKYLLTEDETEYIINEINKENSILYFDNSTGEYSIYPFLMDTLIQEFHAKGLNREELMYRCGLWHEKQGHFIRALRYYFDCGSFQKINDNLLQLDTFKPDDKGLDIIKKIFDYLPKELRYKRPIFYISFVFAYCISQDIKEGVLLYNGAKTYYSYHRNFLNYNRIKANLYLIELFLHKEDIGYMLTLIEKIYECTGGKKLDYKNLDSMYFFGSPSLLFNVYKKYGNFTRNRDKLRTIERLLVEVTNSIGSGCSLLYESEYNMLTGNYDRALELAYQAELKANAGNQDIILLNSDFVLIRSYMVHGYFAKCEELIMGIIHKREKNKSIYLSVDAILTYFYFCIQNTEKIPKWILNIDVYNFQFELIENKFMYILIAMLQIVNKCYLKLEAISLYMREEYSKENYILGIIYSYIFNTVALWNLNKPTEAIDSLAEALSISEYDHIIHPFIEFSAYILDIMEVLSRKNRYAKSIVGNCKAYAQFLNRANVTSGKKIKYYLTDREIEVMRLIMQGYKQSEIGEKLFISVPTVKKHIQKIYRKFDVNNKAEAIKAIKKDNFLSKIILEG